MVGGGLAVLASISVVSAQNELVISQPDFNIGIPAGPWAWQSFTVTQESTISSFAFEWNGGSGNLNTTATVDLLTGQGTGGSLLASATGSVILDNSAPYNANFFTAEFGAVDLAPGQYTVYVNNATSDLEFLGTESDSYAGGEFVTENYGDPGWSSTFYTPAPSAVPEPSTMALAVTSLAGWGCARGYNALKRRGRKFLS
jgi:hypothetical protein